MPSIPWKTVITVIATVVVVNTLIKRVPVAGPMVGSVWAGL